MKRLLLALVFILVCSVFPGKCAAQFQNHIDVYATQSTDSTSSWFYQTVTIDGYTQVPPGMPSYVIHTPHLQNQLGSIGGWFTGSGTCPGCYISFSNDQSNDDLGPLIEEDDFGAEVQCSVAGIFFTSLFNFQVEAAFTRSQSVPPPFCTTGPPVICSAGLTSWCTLGTSPPDFNPSVVTIVNPPPNFVLPPFFDHHTRCFRNNKVKGTPWTCFPTVPLPLPAPQLQAFCTHNP